jgi:hypothetical protein
MQSNDENLEKALLVDVSRVAKSGYLSELNNLKVFPMYMEKFADSFGFTEDEISTLLQYSDKKDQLDGVRQWYNGYKAGKDIHLYNPWSINSFIDEGDLKAYWIDTGNHCLVTECSMISFYKH